jgi:hypothetical protein
VQNKGAFMVIGGEMSASNGNVGIVAGVTPAHSPLNTMEAPLHFAQLAKEAIRCDTENCSYFINPGWCRARFTDCTRCT